MAVRRHDPQAGAPARAGSGGVWGRIAAWAGVAGLVGVSLWWWAGGEAPDGTTPPAVAAQQPEGSAAQWWNATGAGGAVPGPGRPLPDALVPSRVPEADRTFVADAQGRLRLDEQTRLKVEALVALNHGDDLQSAVDEQVAGLPPEAATAARDLVQRYQAYAAAQQQAQSLGAVPASPDAALAELQVLRALRERHFGPEAAERLYGAEEAIARRLLELMQQDPNPDAPMGEKAERAQARYDAERAGAAPAATVR